MFRFLKYHRLNKKVFMIAFIFFILQTLVSISIIPVSAQSEDEIIEEGIPINPRVQSEINEQSFPTDWIQEHVEADDEYNDIGASYQTLDMEVVPVVAGEMEVTDLLELNTALSTSTITTVIIKNDIDISNIVLRVDRSITFKTDGPTRTLTAKTVNIRHMYVSGGEIALTFENVVLDGDNQTGGGINSAATHLTLNGAIIQNCKTTAVGGGGIKTTEAITVIGGKISGNTGFNGGGIYGDGGSIITIDSVEISGNTASNDGGGIYGVSNGINVESGKISGNKASSGGGICSSGDSTVNINGGEISSNKAYNGGGIYALNGAIIVNSAMISDNQATYGGGIRSDRGSVLINGGKINNNTATTSGGGIYGYIGATLNVNDGEISGNTASSGGGIYGRSGITITVALGKINGNTATFGGGIYGYNSSTSVNGGIISGNTATSNGGGIYDYNSSTIINGGEISGNIATNGGGIYGYNSSTNVNNGEISGNTAGDCGGGIYGSFGGSITISFGKINDNKAIYGGGVYCLGLTSINGGEISNNDATYGGGMYCTNYTNLTVGVLVIFFGNTAPTGRLMTNTADISTHDSKIFTETRSLPFVYPTNYAYNNYDIGYTGGSVASIYGITYHANGATYGNVPQGRRYMANAQVTLQGEDDLAWTNHTFKEWNSQADGGGTAYGVNSNFNISTNIDLYAQWKANPDYILPTNVTAVYGQTLGDISDQLNTYANDGTFSFDSAPSTKVGNVGERTFALTYTPNDTDNYNVMTNLQVTVTVSKANPNYTLPSNVIAVYGQTLGDITNPLNMYENDGMFSFDSATSTKVGDVGEQTFAVTYTPSDTDNYNVLTDINVSVTVSKANPTYIINNLTATYGDTLASLTSALNQEQSEGSFSWNDDDITTVGTVGTKKFSITFTPTDTDNYNVVTNLQVLITVSKATPNYIVPTVTAVYGQTLADITNQLNTVENDGTFSFELNTSTSVGTAGERTFIVKYTPNDSNNYHEVTGITMIVTVSKAIPTPVIPSLSATYGDTLASLTNKLNEGQTGGTFSWVVSQTTNVGEEGLHVFEVVYTPNDTLNYVSVNTEVTINVMPIYTILNDFYVFTGKGNPQVRIDAPYDEFIRVLLNGEELSTSTYTVTSGSTIIILKEEYVLTLKNGTYDYIVEFANGIAKTKFVVDVPDNINKETSNPSASSAQSTGDTTSLRGYLVIALLSIGIFIVVFIKLRKRTEEN